MISLEIREISDHSAFVVIVRGQKLSAGHRWMRCFAEGAQDIGSRIGRLHIGRGVPRSWFEVPVMRLTTLG